MSLHPRLQLGLGGLLGKGVTWKALRQNLTFVPCYQQHTDFISAHSGANLDGSGSLVVICFLWGCLYRLVIMSEVKKIDFQGFMGTCVFRYCSSTSLINSH